MIRHIVMFNVRPIATEEEVAAVVKAAKYSLTQIPGVRNLAIGKSFEVVQPPRYQYGLTMEFEDESALRFYIDHPIHQEFRKIFFPIREDFLVMDFKDLEESA